MDINEIKKLVKNSTAVLVLDNGEPSFVVMGYKTYKDIATDKAGEKEIKINHDNPETVKVGNNRDQEAEILERLNKEILALKAQIEMEEKAQIEMEEKAQIEMEEKGLMSSHPDSID